MPRVRDWNIWLYPGLGATLLAVVGVLRRRKWWSAQRYRYRASSQWKKIGIVPPNQRRSGTKYMVSA